MRIPALFPILLLALALVGLAAQPAFAQTCTTEWAASTSGVWSDDGNWTNGAPDAADTACITAPGTYVVTLDRRQALDGLVVGGASGLQTLVMDGTFDPLGSGTIGPNGRVELQSSENCGSCDGLPVVTGTLTVEGTLTHTALVGLLSQGGTLDIAPGGALRVDTGTNSVSIGSGTADARSRLVVRGTLLFDPTDGTTRSTTVLGTFDLEGGTVDVLGSGAILFFQSQGTWTGGTFSVAEDMTVWLTAGAGSNGIYEVTGTLDGSPAGRLLLTSGATFAAGPGGATLAFGGTGLRVEPGSGQTSFFTSAGGAFTNTGLVTVAGNGLWFEDATLQNEGTLDVRTTMRMEQSAELDNVAAGEVRFIDAGQIIGGPDGGLLRSAGRLIARLDASSSARSTIGVPVEIDGGSVETEDAGFFFGSQGLFRNVSFTANEDIWLAAGNGSNGVYRAEGTLSGTATGTLFFGLATLEAGSGGATLDIDGAGLQFLSGSGQQFTLASAGGDFVNTGVINWGGNFNLMTGVALRNEGDLTVRPGLRLAEGATLTNAVGATATFAAGGSLFPEGDNPGTFVNEGLVLKTEGGTTNFSNTLRSQPGSELRVLEGRFMFANENPANYGAGVLLSGRDRVFMTPPQLMQGTVSPGTPETLVDTLSFSGLFRLDDTEGDARLAIDLGPDGADHIATFSPIVLGGTLVVRVLDGYTPEFGDAFTIIRDLMNGAVQGAFSSIEVEGAPEGVSFAVDTSEPGAVVLRAAAAVTVSAPVADTPEGQPAPFVLTHPAAAEPFTINFALGGTATRFADYTVSATGNTVRAQPNTTQTVVTLYPRRDADPNEGPEAVTLEVLLGDGAAPAPDAGQAGIAITDGPSIDALALDGVSPAEGENLGTVTTSVFGTGFGESATVSLDGPVTVEGETVEVTAFGARATFNLAGAPAGAYDVVVQSGGEDATLDNAFTVTEGTPDVPVWASISGTPSPRFGRWSTYTLTVGNDGATDLYDTLVLLRITDELEYEISDAVPVPGAEEYSDITGFAAEDEVVVPLYLYALDAGSTREIRVRVRPLLPINISDEIGVGYSLFPPNPEALFTYSGELDDFEADVAASRRTNWAVLGESVEQILDGEDPATALREASTKAARVDPASAFRTASASRLGGGCPTAAAGGSAPPPTINPNGTAINFNSQLATILSGLARGAIVVVATGVAVVAATAGAPVVATVAGVVGLTALFTAPASASTCGTVGGSFDPNDKLGPGGWAEERFYRPTAGTPYTVRFENLDTATFPAQEVIIVDTLDTDAFDLSTFEFGPIRWGVGGEVVPPPGAQAFETEVSLAPEFDATLLITAALETETGRATWHFVTLDNSTGDLPEDGTVGFLPPNQTQPEGEGSVGFIVDAFPSLSTGTVVANQAEIVFDVNEPIVTPVWLNTVDVDTPISSVQPIVGTEEGPITIEVEGSDLGAGIQTYALYVAEADGPFELYEISREPTFEFEGEEGVLYGFYSIVTDFVQNTEGPKDEAEATIVYGTVANEGDSSLPREVTLGMPYPNPSRGSATLRWGLPEASHVDIRIYDLLGREVARLADSQAIEAGWHETQWRAPRLASGVYIVRLHAEGSRQTVTKTQRLIVVR